MNKLLMVMVLGASAVAASAQGLQRPRRTLGSRLARPTACAIQGQQTCSVQQTGAAEVAVKFRDGGYIPGLQQGVFEKFAQQFSRDFNAILKCGKTCADADRYSHAFGTILADVDVISHEVQNEQMGTVEKFNENDAVLYEGEIYLEGGKEYAFFVAVDDWASIEIDGERILSGGYWERCRGDRWKKGSRLIASKTVEKSGWHPIRVWMCDICGGGVPMLGFGGMGIGWNAEGCKELNAATFSKWHPLRDDGSGRFLRSKPMPPKAAPRCGGLLGGSLRARRLQRQQAAQQVEQKKESVDGYTWSYRVNNGEATIVAENRGRFSCAVSPSPKGSLTIPSTLGGAKVTGIGRAALANCKDLVSVTMPPTVTSIGRDAFNGCHGVTSLAIPSSVKDIGIGAFLGCGVSSATISSNVVNIGYAAFAECAELKQINVDEGNQKYVSVDGVLYTKDRTVLIQCPGAVESVTLSEGMKNIYGHSLRGCRKLKSVTIPHSVSEIGAWAFSRCAGLTSLTIPESVTSIGNNAFRECSGLRSVEMPTNMTSIAYAAFYDCDGLTSVTLPPCVKNIEGWAFGRCNGLKSVKMPECVTNIAGEAFRECGSLTSLSLPSSLMSIGNAAFRSCTNLTAVMIPSNVVSIGVAAFTDCTGLRRIDVSADNSKYASVDGVLYTKDRTEAVMCPGALTSAALPESVTSIGPCAFEGCGELTSVTMPECVTNIGPYAFKRCCKLTLLAIPSRVRSIGGSAFEGCSAMTAVTIPEGVTTVEWHVFHNCRGLTMVTISPNVRKIENWAFAGCTGLRSLTLPRALMSIGRCAFQECRGLTSITIPPNVTEIGPWAFESCRELTSVTIPESVSKVERSVFKDCVKLASVSLPPKVRNIAEWTFQQCEGLTAVTIPEGVTGISEGAFWRCCKLSSVTIPSSVLNIGARTFEGCGGLMSVTMCGGCPNVQRNIFGGCGRLKAIHVPSNSLSWAKLKDWQGIPLVFDGDAMSSEALAREAKAEAERTQREAERAEQRQQLLAIQEELKRVREQKAAAAVKGGSATASQTSNASASGVNVVAQKLQSCDFLLNKDFKKNAKFYLCLFSASWCGPCRREMPRIAKTYAETLKDGPDIELIHFSRDQNDEKALAWAKEHDVKFPVVKPNGGNPLDLHSRGIPHLFIIKADGTLVEEGHPMRIFNEEKFKELKSK